MKEDANQGGTEQAALPEASRWASALPTLPIDPHGQQRAVVQGLECALHVAIHSQVMQQAPQKLPLDVIIG